MSIRILTLAIACLLAIQTTAQVPVPAPKQSQSILIWNATAHLGNGQIIPNSAIAFENGRLTLVADATTIRLDRSKYARIFDAAGKHVYPGFIAANTQLGLVEVSAARATVDFGEVGAFNPNARALVAYNTDSEIQPTVRANGVLQAQIAPAGGLLSGSSSVVQLDAWNWEDAVIRADDGLHLNWPNRSGFAFDDDGPGQRRNEQYERDLQSLDQFFTEAKAYCAATSPEPKNPKFEAMRALFSGKQTLYAHADNARAIREAVIFAKKHGCRTAIIGGNDAWLLTDFLKSHSVPVVLNETQRLPSREDEDVAQPFKIAAALQQAGVLFAFGGESAWQQRNLPFQAGQAVGFGLDKEAAVAALTLNAAKILGIDASTGSLEAGKDATLFVSEGDALDMRSCIVTAAFIQGREISLDNRHKQLNRRFLEKYKAN